MKWKTKLLRWAVCGMAALCPFAAMAAVVGPSDPEVMQAVVTSDLSTIRMIQSDDTGTLLFSDSPEYAEKDGILYSDQVQGPCRLYFYHVNETNSPKKIVVIAYNTTAQPVQVALKRMQYSQPSSQYYTVGKELSLLYYEAERTVNQVTVPAYDYALLGERLNTVKVRPDELFSGIIDVDLPEKMFVSAIIMPYEADPLQFVKTVQVLPSDSSRLRGTFQGINRSLRTVLPYDVNDGIGLIKIADGLMDPFLEGTDVLENRPSENTGNYGLDYTIQLATRGKEPIHLYFNTQGGAYAGVLALRYNDTQKIVEIPRDSSQYNLGEGDAYGMQYIDTFPAGGTVTMRLMPPGAANLPVRLILVPDHQEKKIIADIVQQRQEEAAALARAKAAQMAGTTTVPQAKTDTGKKKRLLLGDWQ